MSSELVKVLEKSIEEVQLLAEFFPTHKVVVDKITGMPLRRRESGLGFSGKAIAMFTGEAQRVAHTFQAQCGDAGIDDVEMTSMRVNEWAPVRLASLKRMLHAAQTEEDV